jgi:hypothetical protein
VARSAAHVNEGGYDPSHPAAFFTVVLADTHCWPTMMHCRNRQIPKTHCIDFWVIAADLKRGHTRIEMPWVAAMKPDTRAFQMAIIRAPGILRLALWHLSIG